MHVVAPGPTSPPAKIEYVYQAASDAFEGLKLPEAEAAPRGAASQAGDLRARVFIDATLVNLGEETQLSGLEAFLAHPVSGAILTQNAAIVALQKVKSPLAEKIAILASSAQDASLRYAGIIALEHVHTAATIQRLGRLLADNDAGTRNAAYLGLCDLAPVCDICNKDGRLRIGPEGADLVRAVALWRAQNAALLLGRRPY
jgi:HEAT repeat protein